jgi:hypothetical protein
MTPEVAMIENRKALGLRFYFDVNFVTDASAAAERLRQLHADGWINLCRTDTVDTELSDAKDDDKSRKLLGGSAPYVESLGPLVFGSSRQGHAVFGNDDDEDRLDRVYRILFPDSDRRDDSTERARRKIRDAMHLATSIRDGVNGFITWDERDLLRKAGVIAAAFRGFLVVTPEVALAFVERVRDQNR